MELNLYQIDNFTDKLFTGNPACVVELNSWLPDQLLLKIAKENAVAETAFFINQGDKILLRWFTPEIEMDLCGHATLATAFCLKTILNFVPNRIVFSTHSGDLLVNVDNNLYHMNFPARPPITAELPEIIKRALNIQPISVFKARDYLLVYQSEDEINKIRIEKEIFDQINLDPGGVIVTAKGKSVDFVSRYFTSQASILEDPVTGSAHCSLTPYWSQVLNKKKLTALQLSERSGKLFCEDLDDRVIISGEAKLYSIGKLFLD
jgi:PhzF family phenazine biosynthesis protein